MKKKMTVALATPGIRLCDVSFNLSEIIRTATEAVRAGAELVAFPPLTLTGATAGDLFRQRALTRAAEAALLEYIDAVAELDIISLVGLPIADGEGRVYEGYCMIAGGEMLGVNISKSPIPPLDAAPSEAVVLTLGGRKYAAADGLVFTSEDGTRLIAGARGEADADILVLPEAVEEYIGAADLRRRDLLSRRVPVCLYVGAGEGESGTDGVYSGARCVAEGGRIVAESPLFSTDILYAEIDPSAPVGEGAPERGYRLVRHPFIPEDPAERDAASALALEIQSRALAGRLERSFSRTAVIGVSGGLDSTLAVLVAARAMDRLGRDRKNIIAITMPAFGTTSRTKSNALALAEELGCSVRTVDIKAAVEQHFADIGHDKNNYNVVYENAQARERTQILMDVANAEGGLVVGTGDLSELALGFATYNGDHMSMYAVNGSVPKTLMREIIAYEARLAKEDGRDRLAEVLLDVINTPVSPELLPTDGEENGQHTEKIVGPYELHDFFLYHTVKSGYAPDELLSLTREAFADAYTEEEILSYLEIFCKRFIAQQFKRSCLPDGPRVTEISLSPRTGYRIPSDAASVVWRDYFKKG